MKISWFWGCLFFLLMCSCSDGDSAGNSVETENTLAIQVWGQDGKPVDDIRTEIRPVWYVADTAHSADSSSVIRNMRTNKHGRIICEGLPLGRYVVRVAGDSLGAVSEINHLDTSTGTDQTTILLSPLGSVHGSVDLPTGAGHAWVQVYGLDNQVKTDSLGHFLMAGLPAGALRLRAIAYNVPSVIAEDVIQVRPLYTMNVGRLADPNVAAEEPETWRYSRWILVDSLVSEWMRPLSDPTVVTLELDSSNFDFSEAMPDGRDLRVLDEQGNLLSFQRARWDADVKKAVIRIRIGTSGMDSSTRLELRWGRPGAIDPGSAGLWKGIGDSLYAELYTLPVDDFERKSAWTAFPSPIPPTLWYVVPSDTSVVLDSALVADFTTAIQPAGEGRSGSAAHISYTASSSLWFVLGTTLGPGPRSLATLDSIVFWVRGTGNYSVSLENLVDVGGKAIYNDTLDAAWIRKCIRPTDMLPENNIGGNVGWDNVKDILTNLSFFSGGGNDFWIDDIRLYGVNRDNLK